MMPVFPKVDKDNKTIEGVDIKKLLNEFGSPLFVISKRIIKEKYKLFRKALNKYYPDSKIAYSVKTNYLPAVLKTVNELGCLAEVISGFEYWLAKRIGFSPSHIILNGPAKTKNEIEHVIKEGALLNLDNKEEIKHAAGVTAKMGTPTNIGIRVNAKIGPAPWTRFGFNLENDEAYEVIKSIKKDYRFIKVNGLHIHIGTNINEPKYYHKVAEKISTFAVRLKEELDINLEYLDLGGGFATPGSRWQNNQIWIVPEIDEYLKEMAAIINKKFTDRKPKLIFEPGRYLIDEATVFLTTVVNSKVTDDVQLLNVDSSVFTTVQSFTYRHNIIDFIGHADSSAREEMTTYIGGNSCVGIDYLARDIQLPRLQGGDILIFYNAGAYTIARNEQWISARPAVMLIEENGGVKCIRRKEDYENMIALDEF